MVRSLLLALCLLPLVAFGLNASWYQPYSGGTIDAGDYYLLEDGSRVDLLRATEEISIRFTQPVTPETVVDYVKAACSDTSVALVSSGSDNLPQGRIDYLHVANSATAVATLAQDPNVSFVAPIFISPRSIGRIGLTDEIAVGAKADVPQEQIEQEMAELGLEFESRSELPFPVYHFRVPSPTAEKVFAAAVAAAGKAGVRFADPGFLVTILIEPPPFDFSKPPLFLPSIGTVYPMPETSTPGSDEPISVRIASPRKVVTKRAAIVLEGTASQNATTLTVRVGKGLPKTIAASEHWKLRVAVPPGISTITVAATSADGSSATDKIQVRRK